MLAAGFFLLSTFYFLVREIFADSALKIFADSALKSYLVNCRFLRLPILTRLFTVAWWFLQNVQEYGPRGQTHSKVRVTFFYPHAATLRASVLSLTTYLRLRKEF